MNKILLDKEKKVELEDGKKESTTDKKEIA